MLDRLKLVCLILVFNQEIGNIAAQQSLRLDEKGDSCQVINFNCGGQSQNAVGGGEMPRNPGVPGKMGPVGPAGPKGSKGRRGSRGTKGEAGKEPDVQEIKSDILEMLSVTSCGELMSKYGVNKTGYYLMRNWNKAAYNYCDFNDYSEMTSCKDLGSRHGLNTNGYYWIRVREDERPGFVFCDFYPYADVQTCKQLQDFNGTTTSGVYSMSLSDNPYRVHCNFTSGAAITEVWHSSMEEVKASPECEAAGCYSWTPQYELPERDVLRITENSQTCRQFIKARCKGMLLRHKTDPRGWWVSRQGEKMLYWGGATSRRDGYCACGETGSCLDNSHKCNCDQNSGDVTTADEGFITDKSKLPVREIRLGDMSSSNEDGWHTLGKLECMG